MRYFSALLSRNFYTDPLHVLALAWLAWALSWWAAALWSRRTASSASLAQEAPYRLLTVLGAFLLLGVFHLQLAEWEAPLELRWALIALAFAGFGWCWWARVHLGVLWSSNVTRKADHRIVDTGPYALTRHPIYTGLLTAVLATGFARGRGEALLGAVLIVLGTFIKARLEERFLSETLGPDYAAYRKRVAMLVPFAPL